jgi:hypothetical protein
VQIPASLRRVARSLATVVSLVSLTGCTTVAMLADRSWSEPPLLAVTSGSESYGLHVLPGLSGVAAGGPGQISLYGLFGLPLMLAGISGIVGALPVGPVAPLIATDLVLGALLELILPGPIGTTGDALEVETLRGVDLRPLSAEDSGRLVADLPAFAFRTGGARTLHLRRQGYRVASWHLRRSLPGMANASGAMPHLQIRQMSGTDAVCVRVEHLAGTTVRDLSLTLAGTVPGSTATYAASPERFEQLAQGRDAVFELRGAKPAGLPGGRTQAWVTACERLGWTSPGLAILLNPGVDDPSDRPWPVVIKSPAFEVRPGGRRADLVLGVSVKDDQGWDGLCLTLRSGDPTILFEQPAVEMGPVLLPAGQSPVLRTGLWRLGGTVGPGGFRIELQAWRAGQTLTWFEDYWWQDGAS